MRVLFTEAAQADLVDALQWYEARAPHMVAPLRLSVREIVARIAANPLQFPAATHNTRRALLRRFPYLLIFRVSDDATYVVAVFHTSRHPRTWRGRT